MPDEDTSSIPVAQFAGVLGTGVGWPGVVGWSTIGRGVKGLTYSGEAGVMGQSEQGSGVLGMSGRRGPNIPNPNVPKVAGVIGSSNTQPGVIGASNASFGLYGFSNNAAAIFAAAGPAAYAGVFNGDVAINGNLTVGVCSIRKAVRCRSPMARTVPSIAWRARMFGSKISARRS